MLTRFWLDDRGATIVEYCLIAGIISMAVVAGALVTGTKLRTHYYQSIIDGLS